MNDLTREEVESLIAQGDPLDLHGLSMRQTSLAELDLSHADLSHADLSHSNLTRANLREANLAEASLEGAALVEARLSGANLRGAGMSNTILRDANLRGANLRDADLRGADLRGADLREATLADADLSDVDLQRADLRGADLSGAQLELATLSAAILQRANLISASLQEARLDQADLRDARLSRASLERAVLAGANLQGAVLTGADLCGADLQGATLFQCDLRGTRYDRVTRWPEGFEPYEAGMIFGSASHTETMLTSIWPGRPYPLGATWDGQGVNFALFAERATRVELCLFDSVDTPHAAARITMPERSEGVWHVYLPNLRPGQLYAYRVYGPYHPDQGLRFNPNKLLLDPYAKAISGDIIWDDALFGYTIGHPDGDRSFDERDSARAMPRSVVIDDSFPWGDDRHPRTPLHQSVIYELHVGGFTMLHPELPEPLRGTYAGLASPPVIDYLLSLGVTAVELLPVHQYVDDRQLVERGLRNYWGYNTIGFFAPDPRYSLSGASGEQVREFKSMVKALHAAGIEVILDVVYNHTAEGNQFGPTLSLRGIDNQTYYRLMPDQPRYYMDYTGCGNTLNVMHPRTLQLIMDSLRYWVLEMHVDGFRFDLASALARGMHEADRLSAFLDIIHQDPVLSQVKLIAEPWDIGPDGYQVGHFPVLWSEWNGKYRDTVRRFWKGDEAQVRRAGLPPDRLQRPLPAQRAAALGQHQLCHRPRRLHPARPGELQPEAQRGQRRPERRRREPQQLLELRRGGADRRPAHQGAAPAPDEEHDRHPAALAGRADAAGRRRARAQPAGQQQRLLPGQRDQLGGLAPGRGRRDAAGVHPAPGADPPRAPGAAPAPLLPGPPHLRQRHPRHPLAAPRRRADEPGGVGARLGALPGDAAERPGDERVERPGPTDLRRCAAAGPERPLRVGALPAALRRRRPHLGAADRHLRRPRPRRVPPARRALPP